MSTPQKKRKKKPLNWKNLFWFKMMLSFICAMPVRWAQRSWRVKAVDCPAETDALMRAGTAVIYAIWHGRMFLLLKGVPSERVAVLVSPSNDGEFIKRIAQKLGFSHFIRGSHKRGGTQAILAMHKALCEDGLSVAFTVDGPRGPRYTVKPGIIRLAAQTGAPIIPIGVSAHCLLKKLDKSWDHFHAPWYFSRLHLAYGEPVRIPAGVSDEEALTHAAALEKTLMRLNLEMDESQGFLNGERL